MKTGGRVGVVAFVGPTDFQSGIWIGVILERPDGKNNGSVDGRVYFKVFFVFWIVKIFFEFIGKSWKIKIFFLEFVLKKS